MSPGPASRGARRFAVVAAALVLAAGCTDTEPDADGRGDATDRPDTSLSMSDLHAAAADEVEDGGTLRIGLSSFPATFNPVHTDGVASTAPRILAPTLGSAVRVADDGTWTVDPNYAREVEVVETDPLTVRVELNKKAVWQGGTPITSADMVSFVEAMQDDDYATATAPVFLDIEQVSPDGRFAYEVEFEDPNADWPAAVYPTLPRAFTKSAEAFNRGMAGKAPSANGPFLVSAIDRATGTITLQRNPRWWGPAPKLESIVWRIGEADVTAEAFKADELEATSVMPANRESLKDQPLRASRSAEWTHLTINGGAGPLADADVRRAVMLAVDRDRIVADASTRYGATADAMDSVVLLPGQRGYTPVEFSHDQDRASKLLKRAGWVRSGQSGPAKRKGRQLTLRLPVPNTNTGALQRAESVAEDLAQVGVKVVVTRVPRAKFFDDVVIPLDFDLTTFAWNVDPFGLSDMARLFTPIDSPLNFTGKASKAVSSAFEAAVEELDDQERAGRITKINKLVRAQASILPLAVVPNVMAVDENVVNFGPTALADLDWTIVGFRAEKAD